MGIVTRLVESIRFSLTSRAFHMDSSQFKKCVSNRPNHEPLQATIAWLCYIEIAESGL